MLGSLQTVSGLVEGAENLVRDYMAIQADEAVLITADTATDMTAVEAVLNSVVNANAKPVILVMPQLPFQGGLADPYINRSVGAAVAECDVWLDFTWPYLAGARIHDEAMKSGKIRYLLAGDIGSGGLARLFGKLDFDDYFGALREFDKIAEAAIGKTARLTNSLGSDITFTLTKTGIQKPRHCDKPGMYVAPGGASIYPEIESVKGVVVINAAFHEYYNVLDTPLTLRIDGQLTTLEGEGADRSILDRSLRRAAGGNYGFVIHLTHGIHPSARFTGTSFIEDSRVMGNNAVGFGLPWWVPGGGENHPDGILCQQSLWIDGQKIAEDGNLIGPPALKKAAEKLVPLYK